MTILTRYILKSHIGPFVFGFATVVFVFLMQFLARYLDRFVGKGLEMNVIIELIVLQIAWMAVLAAPMAVLISTLMTFGNMVNSSEMTAIRASGISLLRIMIPIIVAGAILTYLMERFNNIVLPEANHQAKVLLMDISRAKPSFGLEENVFSDMIRGYTILARKTDEKSSNIAGVTIYDNRNSTRNVVITADSGFFEFTSDLRNMIMTLKHGEMHELVNPENHSYRRVNFETHKVVFEATGYGFERTDENSISRGDRELSATTMMDICDSLEERVSKSYSAINDTRDAELSRIMRTPTGYDSLPHAASIVPDSLDILANIPPKRRYSVLDRAITQARVHLNEAHHQYFSINSNTRLINKYLVEVHKKYAIPFACLFFVFVGVPLGVLARRGGFGIGAGLSLIFFLLYWVFLIGGEKLADRDIVSPAIAMWMGNVVISVIGAVLLALVSGVKISRSR
ncbi:permease YjgP/YjgQ family protein [Chloroherpeton thalassium ATCC 35110]|uniref:Permease YjgP/YjgQ family protein n=1 Tax=Chloroherpeton thalassium (strain ATCC 35110 / GB-78) TaxID=517418 RepID=B3QVN4_CHLT3|nr:LptF/LptG family permease [Chloroherpeton thalassium]ACF13091.1 permease YjgP/YjgQ family protein [Chloroherpeton thalassium ATCC 35110]